jgi:nucleoside-diphosphate-sugar epimerase
MRILLLGGKGYIGSRLDPYLSESGHVVANYDLNWFGDHTPDDGHVKKDFKDVADIVIELSDVIVLLAGHSSVKMCIDDYRSSYNNNVRNTLELVERIRNLNPNAKLIYASSSSIYGNTNGKIEDETKEEFVCSNNYDLTKYIVDQYMVKNNPIPNWYALRFGTVNGYSANFRCELMINSMTKSAVETGKIIISNKHIHRAILGVTDLCEVILQIVQRGSDTNSGIYNINSLNSTVEEIANVVAKVTNSTIEDRGNIGTTYDFMISNEKFQTTFDFKFKQSIEDIVNEIVNNYSRLNMTTRNDGVLYD